jgi:hypothetical protein
VEGTQKQTIQEIALITEVVNGTILYYKVTWKLHLEKTYLDNPGISTTGNTTAFHNKNTQHLQEVSK